MPNADQFHIRCHSYPFCDSNSSDFFQILSIKMTGRRTVEKFYIFSIFYR